MSQEIHLSGEWQDLYSLIAAEPGDTVTVQNKGTYVVYVSIGGIPSGNADGVVLAVNETRSFTGSSTDKIFIRGVSKCFVHRGTFQPQPAQLLSGGVVRPLDSSDLPGSWSTVSFRINSDGDIVEETEQNSAGRRRTRTWTHVIDGQNSTFSEAGGWVYAS